MSSIRDKLVTALNLDSNADDATILAAMDERIAARKGESPTTTSAEDVRIVAAAVKDGRISAASRQTWMSALRQDREGTRRVLASLTPVPTIAGGTSKANPNSAVDAENAAVYAKITGRPYAASQAPQAAPFTPRSAAGHAALPSASNNQQPYERRVITDEEMNAQLQADPELHRAAWAAGVRNIDPPTPRIFGWD